MKFFYQSMHGKMMIGVMSCLFIASVFYVPYSIFHIEREARHRLQEGIDQTKTNINHILTIPMWDDDLKAMMSNAYSLVSNPYILTVSVYNDRKDHIFTFYHTENGNVESTFELRQWKFTDVRFEKMDISYKNRIIGSVEFYYSTVSIEKERWQALQNYFLNTTLLFIVILLVQSIIIRHFIVKPSRVLSSFMSKIAQGQYDLEIPYISEDEIGEIVNAFDAMRKSVREHLARNEQQKDDLTQLNLGLELKVQERTQKLQEHSDALEKEIAERIHVQTKIEEMLEIQETISDNLLNTSAELQQSRNDLEQKATSLETSVRKMEDLQQTYERVLNQLYTLYTVNLPDVTAHLTQMQNHVSKENTEHLQHVSRVVKSIQDTLRPISSLYDTEKAIQSKRVLLAENNRKDQLVAKMALSGTGVDLEIASNLEEGKKLLETGKFDIICANLNLIELSRLAYEKNPQIRSVFMTSEDASNFLTVLQQYPFLSNIVSRNDEDRTFTLKNFITTISKLLSDDLFGMEKYLNWGVDVQDRQVTKSEQRRPLIEEMEQYFRQFGFRKALLTKCGMVAEELLMNAIYDAPQNSEGQSKYNHIKRTAAVVLEPHEYAKFSYACDGMLLGISVQDPFGAFNRNIILRYLEHIYARRSGKIDGEKKGGGGYGLFQIMETSDLMVFNVNPKVRTEVIALFNLDPTLTKNNRKTAFHYFSM